MGYAISTETAIPIIEELIKNGYVVRPWMGVILYTVDEFAVQRYDLAVDEGILLTLVAEGSPANKAGLEVGDVIVSFGGEKTATAEEMIQLIHSSQIGREIEITFWRGDVENTTVAILSESPPPP